MSNGGAKEFIDALRIYYANMYDPPTCISGWTINQAGEGKSCLVAEVLKEVLCLLETTCFHRAPSSSSSSSYETEVRWLPRDEAMYVMYGRY